jgi:HEAT repeat protein
MVLIIPLLLWVWYSLAMGKEYGVMVEKSLKRRSLETNTLEWDDALRTVIKRSLKSEHEDEIVYALRLIPQSDHKFFLEFGVPLLEHVSASVCMEVISRIESTHWETHPRERLKLIVQNLFGRELRPELKGALIQCYLALTNVGDQAVIDEWLEDSNNNTRKGAIVGLLRYRGTDGALNAEKHLLILSQAIDPSSRALAAEIIGNVGIRTFEQPLVDLLHDSDDNVVTTALAAAENVRHPHLLPVVFELVMAPNRSRQVYQSTAECLVAYGHDALPSLRKALFEMHPSAPQFERLVRVVSHIPGVASEEIVTQILHKPYVDPEIRFTALNALVQLRHDTSNSRESIEDLLTSEQVLVGALRSWLHAVSTSNQVTTTQQAKLIELLDRALKWELEQTRQRVLLILALLYDRKTLAKIKENLLYGSHDHRANALELLEHVLPNQTALKILPLFEDSTLALAAGTGKLNKKEFTGVLSSVLSSEWSIGEWTRIIAFEALKTLDTSDSQPVRVHTNIELLDQTKFPMLIERVMTLKTVDIFSETSDNILHYIASLLQEQRFDAGEMFIKKGEMGNCLYVIVEGKVRVHDGDHTLAYLSSRQVVGELSLLDPEPRSASVTTEVETLMLRLDQDDFFDLMADRIEIARAALSVLCKRIRNQNALLAAAHKEPVLDVATQILT